MNRRPDSRVLQKVATRVLTSHYWQADRFIKGQLQWMYLFNHKEHKEAQRMILYESAMQTLIRVIRG